MTETNPSIFEVKINGIESNLIAQLISVKRSLHTQRAYANDLNGFFMQMTGSAPSDVLIKQFLDLSQSNALQIVYAYKAKLIEEGKSEATINRRLSAIRSLVTLARQLGQCEFDLKDVKSEKEKKYRDTSGIELADMKCLLDAPDQTTLKGKRDYALLQLLFENALRRNEASLLDLKDIDRSGKKIAILGKGRGTQKEWISVSMKSLTAIDDYLEARNKPRENDPLFITLDRRTYGSRIGGEAIRRIVRDYARVAGIEKPLSPHKIRHTAITLALEKTNGDVRKVQQFSRHKNVETVLLYDDNRKDQQGEVTDLLSSL